MEVYEAQPCGKIYLLTVPEMLAADTRTSSGPD